MTLSATILEAQEFARRLTLKADGVVLAYDEVLGGFSWASATPATPVTTGTAAQRAAVSGSAGQLFHETDTSVLLQWTAVAAAWKAVAAPGAWTSASRPPVGTTDAAYEGLEIYEQDTGKVMVLRRTTLGSAISGGNPLIWVFAKTYVTAGAGIVVPGTGTIADPYVPAVKNRAQPVNPFRNASFQVWQRGTSITFGGTTWSADGWQAHRASGATGGTMSRQAASDTQGSQWCGRFQRDSGNALTAGIYCAQSIVTDIARHYANKTVTLSFRARCGANFSAASSALTVQLFTGTGTDQNTLSGFTGSANPINSTATLTTSWQTFTYTATLASTTTEIGLYLYDVPVGTAGAADYFEVKDVRIDEGSYALEHIVPAYSADLLDAQHYFWRCGGASTADLIGHGRTLTTTVAQVIVQFPATMRIAPTPTNGTVASISVNDAGGVQPCTAITATGISTNRQISLDLTVASGLTANRPCIVYATATTGYVNFSAEI